MDWLTWTSADVNSPSSVNSRKVTPQMSDPLRNPNCDVRRPRAADEREGHRALRHPRPDVHLVRPGGAARGTPGREGSPTGRSGRRSAGVELEERRVLGRARSVVVAAPQEAQDAQRENSGQLPSGVVGSRCRSDLVVDRGGNLSSGGVDRRLVVPLDHHAGEGLGPRVAEEESGRARRASPPSAPGSPPPREARRAAAWRGRGRSAAPGEASRPGPLAPRAAGPPRAPPGGAGGRSGARLPSARGRGR